MIFPARLATLAAALLLSACAIGNTYDFSTASATVPETGATEVAVAVSDFRPYVLSGDKTPDFVGLRRGGYGNPFDVSTRSGAPLATDLALLLERSFEAGGVDARTIPLASGEGADAARAAFAAGTGERLLLIELREWKTDAFAQVTSHWDVTAKVFDRAGRLLGEDRIEGTLGTGRMGFEEQNSAIASGEAERIFNELLASPAIAGALG